MTVLNLVLDEDVALGFEAEDGDFDVSIVPLSGKREHRNQGSVNSRRRYRFNYQHRTAAEYQALREHSLEVRGMLYGWLLKDWSNYELDGEVILTAEGGETTAQVKQTWGTVNQFSRDIHHIKSGTLAVYLNGSLLSGWSVNSTGLITLGVTLSAGDEISVDAEFYVPVRFEQPSIPIAIDGRQGEYASVPTISVIEDLE